jgi:hypothetical protein
MNFESRSLILVFNKAVDEFAKPKIVRKTFKHFSQTLAYEPLREIGDALAALYELDLNKVCIDDDFDLPEIVNIPA